MLVNQHQASKKPRIASSSVFDLPNSSFAYVDIIKWSELKTKMDADLNFLTVPVMFTDAKFEFADESVAASWAEERKLWREDWEASDMRITHGRAQSPFESEQLSQAVVGQVKAAFPPGMLAGPPNADLATLNASLQPSFFATVKGQSDTKFELYCHPCIRFLEQGSRTMIMAAGQHFLCTPTDRATERSTARPTY